MDEFQVYAAGPIGGNVDPCERSTNQVVEKGECETRSRRPLASLYKIVEHAANELGQERAQLRWWVTARDDCFDQGTSSLKMSTPDRSLEVSEGGTAKEMPERWQRLRDQIQVTFWLLQWPPAELGQREVERGWRTERLRRGQAIVGSASVK